MALLIRRGLVFEQVNVPQQLAEAEAIIIDLQLRATRLRVAMTYRAPNATADLSSLLCDLLEYVHTVPYPSLQLGDFNLAID